MKDQKMKYAKAGENIKIKVKNIEDEDIRRGQIMCNL
jgi:peptide chain release factor subunit 3